MSEVYTRVFCKAKSNGRNYLLSRNLKKDNTISKLPSVLSQSLLGRAHLSHLRRQVQIQQENILQLIKERRTVKVIHVFRNYAALIVVICSAILVSATNLAAGNESSGFLFGYLGSSADNYENPLADEMFLKTNKKSDLVLVKLAQASTSPDPNALTNVEKEENLLMQGQALVAGTSPIGQEPAEDGGVTMYEVQPNDTISSIAVKFGITANTILWANEIENVDSIMPGDKLFILPIAGLAYTIKKSDTLDNVATKYKANKEKIIAFNDLPANGEVKEGQEIIIPDGQKEVIAPTPPAVSSTLPATGNPRIAARPYEPFVSIGKPLEGKAGAGHKFPYGYCTWYVAQRKYVPWGGNAGTWLYHAKAMGYATGRTPKPGSIMVSSESPWGHTGIVESVNGNEFTVSEMNYKGFAKRSTRTVSVSNRAIKGFIY